MKTRSSKRSPDAVRDSFAQRGGKGIRDVKE